MGRNYFYCFFCLLLLTGCVTVSKKQRAAVNLFARKTERLLLIPGKLLAELTDIREERGIFYANSFNDVQTHLDELNSIVQERSKDEKLPDGVASALQILGKYAKGLQDLSADSPFRSMDGYYFTAGTELDTLIGVFNRTIGSSRIPVGTGKLLAQSMQMGSGFYLSHRQAKELRKFVFAADTLLAVANDELIRLLASSAVGRLIQAEESGLQESFRFYLTKRSPPSLESERAYISLKKRIELVKLIQEESIHAIGSLTDAHHKLVIALKSRKSWTEIMGELNLFYRDADKLIGAFDRLQIPHNN